MIRRFILFIVLFIPLSQTYAIDWGTTKPTIDSMLLHYENHKNYKTVIVDQWLKTDGTYESVGDTIFAFKYNAFGYLRNGEKTQVFTNTHDIFINNEAKTIIVQSVTSEDIEKIEKTMPTIQTAIQAFMLCDSARLISNLNGEKTIDFYINNPLINRSRLVIGSNGWIKEIWRYFANNDEYTAQYTKFVLMDELNTSNLIEFNQNNYIQINGTVYTPSSQYQGYTLTKY